MCHTYVCTFTSIAKLPDQTYLFRKRAIPWNDEEKMDMATKPSKYGVSLPQHIETTMETDVPW